MKASVSELAVYRIGEFQFLSIKQTLGLSKCAIMISWNFRKIGIILKSESILKR